MSLMPTYRPSRQHSNNELGPITGVIAMRLNPLFWKYGGN